MAVERAQLHSGEVGSGFPAESTYRRKVPDEQWSDEKMLGEANKT